MNTQSNSAPGKIASLVDWCRRHFGRGDLASLDRAELERMASELNMSVADLASLSAMEEADTSLMYKMMELHGLDVAEIRKHMSSVIRDMEITCARCVDRKLCVHDLAIGADSNTCDQYCPNADTMKALARG